MGGPLMGNDLITAALEPGQFEMHSSDGMQGLGFQNLRGGMATANGLDIEALTGSKINLTFNCCVADVGTPKLAAIGVAPEVAPNFGTAGPQQDFNSAFKR